MTLVCIVGASGKSVPPFFVVTRKSFQKHFLKGAPRGNGGDGSDSGWTNSKIFVVVLKHFVIDQDGYENHASIEVFNYATENGIISVTIPLHCSHKLQLLDLTVFGPLKARFHRACSDFMSNFSGHINSSVPRITIYDVDENICKAFLLAFTAANISKGFQISGIEPFKPNIFTDEDFLTSFVTDIPLIVGQANPDLTLPNITPPPCTPPSSLRST